MGVLAGATVVASASGYRLETTPHTFKFDVKGGRDSEYYTSLIFSHILTSSSSEVSWLFFEKDFRFIQLVALCFFLFEKEV